ncbi:MAG TPA: hypothetical protein VL737_05190 [Candidatus Pristimantibacillus sp.]|nr:hypothetical protein [Candidatus Pristimantibacillus sp.]
MNDIPSDPEERGATDDSADSIRQTVAGTHDVLTEITTRFPFTLFPDSVVLDREKLTITRRFFFRVAEVTTIRVEDMTDVIAAVGPLVGSIRIFSRTFSSEPYEIRYLRREDTLKLERILQGAVIAMQKSVKTSHLSTEELTKLLEELGSSDISRKV